MIESNEKGQCFVLIPFAATFKNQWELAIKPAIQDAGLMASRGDDEGLGSGMIMNDVTRCIYDASIIIADLTGRNSNVMYELGLAHSAQKPVIMIAQSDEDVPFDLSHIRYLKYDAHDLSALREELSMRIRSTLQMQAKDRPRFFPQLKILDDIQLRELAYYRERAHQLQVIVSPETADIFFNDHRVGPTPQVLRVNPGADLNTISVFASDFFEYHAEITQQMLDDKILQVRLEPRRYAGEDLLRRVPGWLRWRRRSPNNPVLMGAVLNFLRSFGEHDDARAEAEEMLRAAPDWYASWNQAGWVFQQIDRERSMECFNKVVALRPDHYIGYFNVACTEAIAGYSERAMASLRRILEDSRRIESFTHVPEQYSEIASEDDFKSLLNDPETAVEFRQIADRLRMEWRNAKQSQSINK